MKKRLAALAVGVAAVLVLAVPALAAHPSPHLRGARIAVVEPGKYPSWKVSAVVCYTGSGILRAELSELTYNIPTKFSTLQVKTRATKRLADPGSKGCAWYSFKTYKSVFPNRRGWVHAVELQVFASTSPGRVLSKQLILSS